MATCKELEKRINNLEEKVDTLIEYSGVNQGVDWIWDTEAADRAADKLAEAFDWDECPKQPKDFESWDDVHTWLESLEFK